MVLKVRPHCMQHDDRRCVIEKGMHKEWHFSDLNSAYSLHESLVRYLDRNFPDANNKVEVYRTLGDECGPHVRAMIFVGDRKVYLYFDTSKKKLKKARPYTLRIGDKELVQYSFRVDYPRGWRRTTK